MKVLKDCSFKSVFLYDHGHFVVVVLCYGSVEKIVSYLIVGVMDSMLALCVLDPWNSAPVWSNQGL
jgi:hypothetical protein